jgi:prepilin-type N-terminal cleavage/methylation domain-containing protein
MKKGLKVVCMNRKLGFTLVELIVVIIVIGILAAVAVPMMQGRIDSAKWSEGKTLMGSIASALRAYVSESGNSYIPVPNLDQLGFVANDLNGRYFTGGESGIGDFSWVITSNNPLRFLITAKAPVEISSPSQMMLDQTGKFTETP